ncbi:glycolate oxidase subunit GlcF [Sinorhizobium saheli]|uniref:glycolate oxidase subunit GlcF n=1 Tax=Sinorhizobium saheli TaxID=36856 RepID=UPI000A7D35BF|nr:glycolate oxidase subunit GlcF [Sinorhizobium saheli]MQW87330.1 glycolate oxidase subunit GlcF [Sinorhizobium saheli]
MQTNFSPEQLADPHVAESEKILRKCVHCGFCTATCPTYVVLGDELDSPRGRIYLIKDMLENGRAADAETVAHIDRCLSCLSCMTTCPSGVDYMHLVDHARVHIEKTYKRPFKDRLARAVIAATLPYPSRFRLALRAADVARPFADLLKRIPFLKTFGVMLDLAPRALPTASGAAKPAVYAAKGGVPRGRVALLTGCAQPVLKPEINEATIRLLTGQGIEVVVSAGEGCCGALVHHMGREEEALKAARRNVDVWLKVAEEDGLDAIVITASGCGTTIKDYGHMLRLDPAYAEKAAKVSVLAKDITEYLAELGLPEQRARGMTVAYHSACSMQHGQKITNIPKQLLKRAGFTVRDPAEGHLCCGSAGTYNILQPEISAKLKARKVKNIEATKPNVIATGNIGCITQIASGTTIPILHTVELLDWAYGGPRPTAL